VLRGRLAGSTYHRLPLSICPVWPGFVVIKPMIRRRPVATHHRLPLSGRRRAGGGRRGMRRSARFGAYVGPGRRSTGQPRRWLADLTPHEPHRCDIGVAATTSTSRRCGSLRVGRCQDWVYELFVMFTGFGKAARCRVVIADSCRWQLLRCCNVIFRACCKRERCHRRQQGRRAGPCRPRRP
jgi:hypothetical protein